MPLPLQFLPLLTLLMCPPVFYLANLLKRNSQAITTAFLALCNIGTFVVLFMHSNDLLPETTFLTAANARLFVIDSTSCLMLTLISFISLVTFKYGSSYLEGNAQQKSFLVRLTMLTACIGLLVACNDVRLLAVLSTAISVILADLVGQTRSEGGQAASRMILKNLLSADILLIAASFILSTSQTYDIAALSEKIIDGAQIQHMTSISILLALYALIKSAIFPFHSWLKGSLEAPTPLSAFLHAGVVNIAGFLAIKFSPLLSAPYSGGYVLAGLGLASAFTGAMISITRPDVKGKLVYSTVAQMGFMCLQCGIGALHAALFHLIFHGCFKCYLFLNSGSAIIRAKEMAHTTGHHFSERLSAISAVVAVTLLILTVSAPSTVLPITILAISMLFELSALPDNPLKEKLPIATLFTYMVVPACLLLVGYALGTTFFSSYVVHIGEHPLGAPIIALVSALMLNLWIFLRIKTSNNYLGNVKDWLYVWANNGGYTSR